ncbi:hypothetical protein [Moraxella ovis]|uniref:hypothetical protein n=1 Tax=Moraxella ovis TaxID=29433 RepID=UPI0011C031E7|nr:hypothetical protein [Moraxella ovis]
MSIILKKLALSAHVVASTWQMTDGKAWRLLFDYDHLFVMETDMFKKSLAALVMAGAAASAHADSVSGTMDLQVQLPEVLVLYHWTNAGIEFNPIVKGIGVGRGVGTYGLNQDTIEVLDNNSESAADLTDDPLVTTTVLNNQADTNKVTVTLKDAWAVRSISNDGVKLKVENTDSTHLHDGDRNSKVKTENVKVKSSDAVTKTAEEEIELNSKWKPIKGDITFDLDFSEAKKAGLHKSDDQTFTLTLTAK